MKFSPKYFLLISIFWQFCQINANARIDNAIDVLKDGLIGEAEEIAELKKKMDKIEINEKRVNVTLVTLEERMDKWNETVESIKTEFKCLKSSVIPEEPAPEDQLQNNKWNPLDIGPNLNISDDGLEVKSAKFYSLSPEYYNRVIVRAKLSVEPKLDCGRTLQKQHTAYYELKILDSVDEYGTDDRNFGFCRSDFPLEGSRLGEKNNSIGVLGARAIWNDGTKFNFYDSNYSRPLKTGDVAVVGLIYTPNGTSVKFFTTLNGKLLGIDWLSSKFLGFKLYPAANFIYSGQSINANFGASEFRFNLSNFAN